MKAEAAASSAGFFITNENAPCGVVLVVDDDKSVLKNCAKMVELSGFKALTARDGLEAVAAYREYHTSPPGNCRQRAAISSVSATGFGNCSF